MEAKPRPILFPFLLLLGFPKAFQALEAVSVKATVLSIR